MFKQNKGSLQPCWVVSRGWLSLNTHTYIYIYMGVVPKNFAWGPPIASQSRSNRDPTGSPEQRWSSLLVLFRFSLSCPKRWPSSIHTWKLEGGDIARMGRASLAKLVQSPSNRGPTMGNTTHARRITSFQALLCSEQGEIQHVTCPPPPQPRSCVNKPEEPQGPRAGPRKLLIICHSLLGMA